MSIEVETFDVLEQVSKAKSITQLATFFRRKIEEFGLTNFLITDLPPETTSSFEPSIIHCAWPEPWREEYFDDKHWKDDPVADRVLSARQPFFWSEIPARGRGARVMDAAACHSLRNGFTIPIWGPGGAVSCISMAGPQCRFPERGRQAIHLMATYVHMKATELKPLDWRVMRDPLGGLTERERECLRWAAAGKTDWEIATILRISENTANRHVTSATRKLGCVNRTHAVATAIARREIIL